MLYLTIFFILENFEKPQHHSSSSLFTSSEFQSFKISSIFVKHIFSQLSQSVSQTPESQIVLVENSLKKQLLVHSQNLLKKAVTVVYSLAKDQLKTFLLNLNFSVWFPPLYHSRIALLSSDFFSQLNEWACYLTAGLYLDFLLRLVRCKGRILVLCSLARRTTTTYRCPFPQSKSLIRIMIDDDDQDQDIDIDIVASI